MARALWLSGRNYRTSEKLDDMANWKVKVWEVGRDRPIETEHHGDLNREQVIAFFGLREPDVVRYEVEEIK